MPEVSAARPGRLARLVALQPARPRISIDQGGTRTRQTATLIHSRRNDGRLSGLVKIQPPQLLKIQPAPTSLGITGGEPTLFGEGFIDLLHHVKNWLPRASLHVLSNGRSFADEAFARAYAAVDHPDLMVGIPVYSDDPARHDYVVQARGAFDETIRGILNLKRCRQKVEIRVVLHKQTCEGLPRLAEYIVRNLLFVDHVALMGLEMTGFTRANLDALWIDPIEYRDQLSEAVGVLRSYGIPVSVFNHPLCLVNRDVEPCYVKSISDWKNEFARECEPCKRKHECGGFFSSGIRHGYSQSITPFTNLRGTARDTEIRVCG